MAFLLILCIEWPLTNAHYAHNHHQTTRIFNMTRETHENSCIFINCPVQWSDVCNSICWVIYNLFLFQQYQFFPGCVCVLMRICTYCKVNEEYRKSIECACASVCILSWVNLHILSSWLCIMEQLWNNPQSIHQITL